MRGVEVDELRTLPAVAALSDEWDGLASPSGTPLLDHDWFLSAAEALHGEGDLRVMTVREDGVLTAVAPLVADRGRRRRVLLGASALHEPSGWLFRSEESLGHLATAVARCGEMILLQRLPAALPLSRLLPGALRGQAVTVVRATVPSFAVRTDRAWDDYCTTLSARTRRSLDAARDRSGRFASDAYVESLTPRPVEVDGILKRLTTVEDAGWKGRGGSSLSARPALANFFRGYSLRAAERGRLRFTALRVGGETAAAELAVQAYGRRWGLKIGYDERFAACAPALQVVHASIKDAFDQGLKAYEFLGSAEPWQERWKPDRRDYSMAAVYPFSYQSLRRATRDVAAFVSSRMQRPR